MKKRTKLTICLGVICALLVAISSWYTIAFNNSRFIVPMDLSEYVFRVQDLPMIISGVLLTLYIVNIVATVYKGNIIKNLIMDCQSYTKYRPNETTGGIFVSWRRKEELPTGA